MNSYPHMCRDGHVEIGHSDSEHEMCPMCRVLAARATPSAGVCVATGELVDGSVYVGDSEHLVSVDFHGDAYRTADTLDKHKVRVWVEDLGGAK